MDESFANRPSEQKYWRTPLDLDSLRIPHGEVQVVIERCKGCEFCVEYCPRDVLRMSSAFNAKGYHYPEAIKANSCVDCNLCAMICPEFAIFANSAEPQTVAEAETDTPTPEPADSPATRGAVAGKTTKKAKSIQ